MTTSAQAKNVSTPDFVQTASIANDFEIESSELALQKSQNSEIKKFARMMVDDHTKTAEEMKEALASSQSKAKPAESLDSKHQQLLDTLTSASASRFDRQYIDIQRDAHKEAVSLFGDYSQSGEDPALKDFASKTLPTLKEHLGHVEQLQASHEEAK